MSAFWGVVRYEYRMSIRRRGLWVASALAGLPFAANLSVLLPEQVIRAANWSLAGAAALMLNLLMPVAAAFAMADRLPRDWQLGVRDLLSATPLSQGTYVLGKYAALLLAALTPVLGWLLLLTAVMLGRGAPLAYVPQVLVAWLAINVPAYVFVGALTLAWPAVLPVRVYQILFAGYWVWANYVNPQSIPTLRGTPLTPSGELAAGALFQAGLAGDVASAATYTVGEAALNLAVLVACAAATLVALVRYLAWQKQRA
jgi:ABC-2 type transport system permease protein